MPNTQQKTAVKLPSGKDIYDALMGKIELDLVSTNIPHLTEWYQDETQEQRAVRYARYAKAYAAYDAAFADWSNQLSAAVATYRRAGLASAEEQAKAAEKSNLDAIEAQFSTAI